MSLSTTALALLCLLAAPTLAQNDECSGALAVAAGTHPFSSVGATTSLPFWPGCCIFHCYPGEADVWFRYVAPVSSLVTVDTCGSQFDTTLEVFAGECSNLASLGCNDDWCSLSSRVQFNSQAGAVYHIRVGAFLGFTGAGVLSISDGSPVALGTAFCPAPANSTGNPGFLRAWGSLTTSQNDLTLTATSMPEGQFALFLASRTQGFVHAPGGSLGDLCLVGSVARLTQLAGTVVGSEYSRAVDLTSLPEPPSFAASVQPGETWYFQCWYRDTLPSGPASNFTSAVEIAFQ